MSTLLMVHKMLGVFLVGAAVVLVLPATVLMSSSILLVQQAAAASVVPDFNGDGFRDLAIGVPDEDVGSVVSAGAVNVIYGSASGLSATAALPDQFWSQDSPGIEGVAEDGDIFGSSLATGDFNNDGYSDLAIGAYGEDLGSVSAAGAVNVIYGSSQGLKATAVSPGDGNANQLFSQDSANIEDIPGINDYFAYSLAAGDFNNDGYSDLAVGVINENLGTVSTIVDAGAVNVIYGSASGLSATAALPDQFWSQDSPGIEGLAENSDLFSYSLAAGDFNNDGYSDLAVGVRFESIGSVLYPGAVNVIYGSASGLSATAALPDQFWTQDSPGIEDIAETNNWFGSSLATGDFNNDGYSDLVVGVPYEYTGTVRWTGAVNVIYGSASGLSATAALPDQFWSQDSPGIEGVAEDGDIFGSSLATGDFNNDGYTDLVVGVSPEDLTSGSNLVNAGAVNVIYGSASGLSATAALPDQFWSQDSYAIFDIAEAYDYFAYSLAAGDFNNDGYSDLALGVPNQNVGAVANTGAVNVIYGSASGLAAANNQMFQQNASDVEDTAEYEDGFGMALAAG